MKKYIYVLVFSIFISCSEKKLSNGLLKFEREVSLKGEPLVREELVDYSYLMEEYGDYLILANFRNNGAIKIIEKSTGKRIFDGIDFGGGPNDIFIPISIYVDPNDGNVYLQDGGSNKIKYFNFEEFLKEGKIDLNSIDIPNTGDRIFPVFPFGGSDFLGVSLDKDKELFLFNNSKVIDTLFYYENDLHDFDVPKVIYGLPKDGRYGVNREKDLIVKALLREPEIKFFDLESSLVYSYRINDDRKYNDSFDGISGRFSFDKSRNYYYVSSKEAGGIFYFLFSNTPDEDVDIVLLGSEIHAFNVASGTFFKYKLDRLISDFVVDESRGFIYGVNFTSSDPVVQFPI